MQLFIVLKILNSIQLDGLAIDNKQNKSKINAIVYPNHKDITFNNNLSFHHISGVCSRKPEDISDEIFFKLVHGKKKKRCKQWT